jgi:hypothetical protein
MSKRTDYVARLAEVRDKSSFLRQHCGLPGPRGNLELVQAAADVGGEADFREWIARGSPGESQAACPTDEFLVACGVVGLGRLVAEGGADLVPELQLHAADRRWRVREGVAMALQRVGDADPQRFFTIVSGWMDERPYVLRAVVAAVAEPRLLRTADAAAQAVSIVDRVMTRYVASNDRRSEESRTLRQALGYCWSVVIVSDPERGKTRLEYWATSPDPDARWIVRENLKKARLARLDPAWATAIQTFSVAGRSV